MFLKVTRAGKTTQLEFDVQFLEEKSEFVREWKLVPKDTSEAIVISFLEEAYVFKKVISISDEVIIEGKEIEEWVNEFLKEELERRQEGFDASEENDSDDPQPYDPQKISIRNERWSLSHVFELIHKYEEIDLTPDFQRNFIWDRKRRSQLIESLMLRIPIPAFYLSETDTGRYQVVDGLQRLSTIRDFLSNKFSLRGLEYLKEQEGRFFKQVGKDKGIDREFVRTIQLTQINVNIIEAKSPTKVKYDVFRRVNTGGKPLNNQEIRNCLAEKGTRNLINDLASSEVFNLATGNSVKTTRMQAQELVLRFIAFWYERTLKSPEWDYKGNMTGYLDDSIEQLNRNKTRHHDEIRIVFERAMHNAYYLFGRYAFRKCLPEHLKPDAKKQLINRSLFTTWAVSLGEVPTKQIKDKIEFESFSVVLAEKLATNKDYFNWVSYKTNDKASIDNAFKEACKLLDMEILKK